jgi:hypothetical protein
MEQDAGNPLNRSPEGSHKTRVDLVCSSQSLRAFERRGMLSIPLDDGTEFEGGKEENHVSLLKLELCFVIQFILN